jgi:hypothetical protein
MESISKITRRSLPEAALAQAALTLVFSLTWDSTPTLLRSRSRSSALRRNTFSAAFGRIQCQPVESHFNIMIINI